MLKAGIKFGPDDWEILRNDSLRPEFCEVWFRWDWKEKYRELFDYLKTEKILFGLHFWAILD